MKDFIKNAGVIFWLNAAACLLSFIGMILLAVSNGIRGYAITGGGTAVALAVIGFILAAVATFGTFKFGSQHFITAIARVVSIVLIAVAFGILLSDRVGLASSLFTWDSHNEVGWNAFNLSIGSAVLMLISIIVMILCAFMNNKKKVNSASMA